MDAINDDINDKLMDAINDAINDDINDSIITYCCIAWYIISMHSLAQYHIIFLHYCDNIYFLITVCNGDME